MTVWRKAVSWSKFKLALECPLRLQKTIDKEFYVQAPHPPSAKGKFSQKILEAYFNAQLNLKKGGRERKVIEKIARKVMDSPWAKKEQVTEDMLEEGIEHAWNGVQLFAQRKLLDYSIRSEVPLQSVHRGFRLFGMLDFLVELPKGVCLYDGKGNAKPDADPKQILYYALTLHAAQKRILEAGFLYWRHGFVPVDVSPRALLEFIKTDYERALPIFEKLQKGVAVLEARPSNENCFFCPWKATCEFSAFKKAPAENGTLMDTVTF